MNGGIRWGRIWSMAHKEVRHVLRDPFTLALAVGLPVLLVIFFGFIIDFDVQNIHMASVDRSQSALSRQFLETFTSSQYFDITAAGEHADPQKILDEGRAKGVVIIEPHFERAVARGRANSVQILLDGADNQTASIIAGYLMGIQNAVRTKLLGRVARPAIELRTRFLFNPELNSRWFVIPGLTVVVVGMLSILLTALTIAREWENGSMELLLSTPVRPTEIIIGKLLPYTLMGLGGIAFVYFAARFIFGIPFRGSHLLFLVACLLFLGTTLSQGLVISVITRQQQLAMQLANITGMLPSILLSGFIFPIESMPVFFRYFTALLPARWFMTISRGIFLKGSGLFDLAVPLAALACINAFLIFLAVKKFKRDLEP